MGLNVLTLVITEMQTNKFDSKEVRLSRLSDRVGLSRTVQIQNLGTFHLINIPPALALAEAVQFRMTRWWW